MRHAVRLLVRNPGFTAVAVITLALGIGATTAIFSVVHAVLLSPLGGVAEPDRLVRVMAHLPASESPGGVPRRTAVAVSAAEIDEIRARSRSLSHVGTVGPTLMGLTGIEGAARLQGARVSASMFPMLGARAHVGRTFEAGDQMPGRDAVVLLAYETWQRFFAGDQAIVGRELAFGTVLGPRRQRHYRVIGVMPRAFGFPSSETEFWLPLTAAASGQDAAMRGPLLGRLAEGVSLEAAAGEIAPIVRALRGHSAAVRYEVVREQDEVAAPVRPALLVLMAGVGIVLLIACVNVANLLLTRAVARERELAVRAALGAGRRRLIRQALTESLLLAGIGGVAGAALAVGGVALLRRLATTLGRVDLPGSVAIPRLNEVTLDVSVLVFTVVTTIATGLLFGLAPAVHMSFANPIDALKRTTSGAGGTGGGRRFDLRGLLVTAEIALTMVLLIGGALLAVSFLTLARVEAGYEPANVLTFQVSLPVPSYPDERLRPFAEALVERVRSLPGVRAAAYANQLPMVSLRDTGGGLWRTPPTSRPAGPGSGDARLVSRDYFDAMRIRIVAGRGFDERDDEGRPRVLLVNETLARREFPGESPIGQMVYVGRDPAPYRIVGLVADVRQFGLDREPEPQFFIDLRQWTLGGAPLFPLGAYYAVRTDGDPERLVPEMRRIVRELEIDAALFNVAPMETIVSSTLARPRMYAVLLGAFAAASAALAVIGIGGVIAHAVTQRRREIGIRMALGARSVEVVRLVLRQTLWSAAVGIGLGVLGAAGLTRYLESLLFGLTPLDRTVFLMVPLAFGLVAALAAYAPARRATRVDPVAVLRSE